IGGGALLAAACDLRVAADDLAVAIPEVAIGIPLTWAGLPRLVREIGLPRTRELVMTGRRLGAAEAQAWGYVHRVVPPPELDGAVDALVSELLAQPPAALALTVDALRALGRALSAPETAWAAPALPRPPSPPRRSPPPWPPAGPSAGPCQLPRRRGPIPTCCAGPCASWAPRPRAAGRVRRRAAAPPELGRGRLRAPIGLSGAPPGVT